MKQIVVIGAGQAGAALVAALRQADSKSAITLVGEEPEPPYQRPPLSKSYLLGEMAKERLHLRPESYYADHDITLVTGVRATGIRRADRAVTLEGREALTYDVLALTTGAAPRRLPAEIGGTLSGVHVVRTLADVDAMAPEITAGRHAVIIGGGYIGLEAAAVARKCGMDVTVIEAADRILSRVASRQTADFFRDLHERQGVKVLEGVAVARLTGEAHVTRATLTDGTNLAADVVIVGVGVTPCTTLAETAGLVIDNGIAVDTQGRTSDPAIWACGDCASFPWHGARLRLESVQNAVDHAECVALNILGAGRDYAPQPWFWSDQYDVKLQIAGLNSGWTDVVARAGTRPGSISHWYFRNGDLISVDAMNDPRAYMIGKRMIESGQSPCPSQVADNAKDLKALLAAV